MFYALTRKTTAKVASCRPRVYADLLKDSSNITQQVEKANTSRVPGLGFDNDSKILMWLWDDHNQSYEGLCAKWNKCRSEHPECQWYLRCPL